ncbi:TIGR01777 family oxidoreductase [Bacillaceae bacterium W0354]
MKRKVVIAGGSGLLGQSLAPLLIEKGYEVVILTRGKPKVDNGVSYVYWDGETVDGWSKEIEGSYAVVNFTGKSINCIYTKKNKEEIINSRVNSVTALWQAIRQADNPPQAFINSGALAIYGNTRDICDENAPHGTGFSVNVCELWEDAFYKEKHPDVRQVLFRIGMVLTPEAGALEPLKKLVKLNLGGTVGSGKQYFSWIHIDDMNEMIIRAIENDSMQGTYNASTPKAPTNKEFMQALRKVMGKGWAPPAPSPFVWLGAYLFMRVDPEIALEGRYGYPKKLLDEGYEFIFPDLDLALEDLVK